MRRNADEPLRALERQFSASPDDTELADRLLRAAERTGRVDLARRATRVMERVCPARMRFRRSMQDSVDAGLFTRGPGSDVAEEWLWDARMSALALWDTFSDSASFTGYAATVGGRSVALNDVAMAAIWEHVVGDGLARFWLFRSRMDYDAFVREVEAIIGDERFARDYRTGMANPPRRRGRVTPRSFDLNRNGFPWPVRTECYHATTATKEILKTGFLTREQGAPEALGGRWKRSVSFTLSFPRAASIALGLETLILGASGRMSCVELLERLAVEVPGGIPGGLTSGYDLQDVVFEAQKAGVASPVDALLPVFERIDQGWAAVAFFDEEERASIPSGSEQIGYRTWLVPPGRWAGLEYVTDHRKAFFETYRSVLSWAANAHEAFNPIFTGTDMASLAQKDPGAVGVIVARVMIPRVCTDARGAVRLGYVTREEMKTRPEIANMLQPAEISCQAALEAQDEYDVQRGKTELGLHRWFDPKIGGYTIVDAGERTRRNTMLFHEREEELIVYATDMIVVDEVVYMPELREQLGIGDRITFPWFNDDEVDVRVVRT